MVTWIAGDKITAAKLNAMQTDWLADNLEGDYTSYVYVWAEDYSATLGDYAVPFKVSNTGVVYFTELNEDTTLYKITYAGVKSSIAGCNEVPYVWGALNETKNVQSLLGTYFALAMGVQADTTVRIYKNDALLQTIDISSDNANITGTRYCMFSPNGRYLAIIGTTNGGDTLETVILYEADV